MDRAFFPKVLLPSKRVLNGASGLLELSSSRGRGGEHSRESLHPKHPRRASSITSPSQVLHTKGSKIDISGGTEHNSSAIRRRHDFYCLPNWDTREDSPTQPLARRRQSCSELDLRASVPEELPWKMEAGGTYCGRNLELELNMMHFELLSLKEKMESSFAHIEKEKQWLEMTCSEDRKRKGDLDDKLFSLETELVKAGASPGKWNHGSRSSLGSSQNTTVEELAGLQSSLLAHKSHIKALEEKQEEMRQKLETVKEEKVALCQEIQHLTLELEQVRKQLESSNDQVSALRAEFACAKTQVNHKEKEKLLTEEQLESIRQACKTLSFEAAQSHQDLEASLEKLHRSEAEKKILELRVRELEKEQRQKQLPEEADRSKLEEKVKVLQETCANLRESWRLLQREKDLLQARTLELEAALQAKQEVAVSRPASQEHIAQGGRERQGQRMAATKTREEELQNMSPPGLSAKGLDANVTSSPQGDQESLRRQHRLVTEQLKGLFMQQQQTGYQKHRGGLKEGSSGAAPKSQGLLVLAKSTRLPEEGQAELQSVLSSGGENQSLQQQLREKSEIITSMASEIQALKQKNEALMKAKLRFQQKIQEICRFSKQGAEASRSECLVPQLSTNTDRDVPSPRRTEVISSICSGENWPVAAQEAQLHSGAKEEQSCVSSDMSVARLSPTSFPVHGNLHSAWPLPSPPGSSGPTVPSVMLSLTPAACHQEGQGHLEGEGTLLSPWSSALLSPRPFGSPRPWSPFKFRGSPEPSEGRTEGEL